jgi:competence protein ComEC
MIKVYFIWVGQGDCTLIQTDNDELILIDCGTSDTMDIFDDNVKPTIQGILNSFNPAKTQIDYLILTHSDKDHVNLVSRLFDIVEFKELYFGGSLFQYHPYIGKKVKKNGKQVWEMSKKIKSYKTLTPRYFNLATRIINTTDFKMSIVAGNYPFNSAPPATPFAKDINQSSNRSSKAIRAIYDNNGNSLIVVINYKGVQAMFMGDATQAEQEALLEAAKKANELANFKSIVFKMSHHGSPESFSKDFTNQAPKPEVAVASAGVAFGHPSEQSIDEITTLEKSGADKHEIVMYDDTQDQYEIYDSTEWIFNTMRRFDESATTVPTHTATGKRKRDSHAGEPYLEMKGRNWLLEIQNNGGVKFSSPDPEKIILTTKGTTSVTAKKKRKKGP